MPTTIHLELRAPGGRRRAEGAASKTTTSTRAPAHLAGQPVPGQRAAVPVDPTDALFARANGMTVTAYRAMLAEEQE